MTTFPASNPPTLPSLLRCTCAQSPAGQLLQEFLVSCELLSPKCVGQGLELQAYIGAQNFAVYP